LRATLKAARLIVHLLTGLVLVAGIYLLPPVHRRRERIASWWHTRLLSVLHVIVTVRGTPMAGPRVLVANHVSWLDIPVIGAFESTRFVSKYEVKEWPIAGHLATAAGTFYIRRGAGGTKQLIDEISTHLAVGTATIFPEGTTTDGTQLLRFQPRLFATAIGSRCPVQPLALRYGNAGDGSNIAPFIGDDDLVHHLLRVLKEPSLTAELTYCDPIDPAGMDRAQLAQATQAAVSRIVAPSRVPADPPRRRAMQSIAA